MLAYVSIICTQPLKNCLAHRDCILLQSDKMKLIYISRFEYLYTILLYIDENVLPEIFLD